LEKTMLLSFLHYKSWLRLDLLAHPKHARKWFAMFILRVNILWQCLVPFKFCPHEWTCQILFLILLWLTLVFVILSNWNSLLERFLPRQISMTRAKREWEFDIISRYHSLVWEKPSIYFSFTFDK
jgi:hypothetical protein